MCLGIENLEYWAGTSQATQPDPGFEIKGERWQTWNKFQFLQPIAELLGIHTTGSITVIAISITITSTSNIINSIFGITSTSAIDIVSITTTTTTTWSSIYS